MLINGKELMIGPDANLQGANLQDANLRHADLRHADLRDADLRHANLQYANLQDANLYNANLRHANLYRADLYNANLRHAGLRHADLRNANLLGVKDLPPLVAAQLSILPAGDLIGWKKLADDVICKLLIPAKAARSNATGRKCRAQFAKVLEGEGHSEYDIDFKYKVGKIVRPTELFDPDRWNECSTGIHFYITREEAEDHY